MDRFSLFGLVIFGLLSPQALGQVDVQLKKPPQFKQSSPSTPPIATKQQVAPTPQKRQPAPTAEDWLKLFLPPPSAPEQGVGQRVGDGSFPVRGGSTSNRIAGSRKQLEVPIEAEVQAMSARQQQRLLRRALASLDEDLSELSTGEAWQAYLMVDVLGSGLWCRTDAELDEFTRINLSEVLDRFASVNKDQRYREIHELRSFRTVQVVLAEYAMEPIARDQRRLRTSTARLDESLRRIANGNGWKAYLKVDELHQLASRTGIMDAIVRDRLRQIGDTYDQVEQNPAYRVVSGSPGFLDVREDLRRLDTELLRKMSGDVPARRPTTLVVAQALPDEHARRWNEILSGLFGQSDPSAQTQEDERTGVIDLLKLLKKNSNDAERPETREEFEQNVAAALQRIIQARQQESERLHRSELILRQFSLASQAGWVSEVQGRPTWILPLPDSWNSPEDGKVLQLKEQSAADREEGKVLQLKERSEVSQNEGKVLQLKEESKNTSSVYIMQFGEQSSNTPDVLILQFTDCDGKEQVPMLMQFSDRPAPSPTEILPLESPRDSKSEKKPSESERDKSSEGLDKSE